MRIWIQEGKRALWSLRFGLAVLGFVCVLAFSGMEDLWVVLQAEEPAGPGHFADWITNCLSSQAVSMALPVLCCIPYASVFQENLDSGFVKMLLPRSTRMRYLCAHGTAVALSGAAVPSFGILSARFLVWLLLRPLEMPGETVNASFGTTILLFALSGTLWALVGASVSVMTRSHTMAYAASFIVFYLLLILQERYLVTVSWIHPASWLFPGPDFPGKIPGACALVAEQILIWWLLFINHGSERLRQL